MEKLITIVIPCKNEQGYIKDLLFNLKQQDIGKTKIYLADANSTDQTRELAEGYAYELGLNMTVIPGGLPARGRNNGARLAKTPYVLFLDADITFTKFDAIQEAVDCIYSGKFNMVSTNPVYRGEYDVMAWLLLKINKYITLYLSKSLPFAIGGFTLVNKNIFWALEGYNEKVTQSEDWLLSKQIPPSRFKLIPDLITQDNRRFKRYGYLKMIKLIFNNWINRNKVSYFYNDQNYWK
jgi:glycosyltransferase involved in cell wall biosynthesis